MPNKNNKVDRKFQEPFKAYPVVRNFGMGASVGLINSLIVTPILNYNNHVLYAGKYSGDKDYVPMKFTAARAFDGLRAYNISAVLRVGTSISVNSFLLHELSQFGLANNAYAKTATAVFAGMIAGATASLPEAIAQTQQLTDPKPAALQVIKTAYQQHGFFGLTRGMSAIMLRSGCFSMGFLRLLPEISRHLRQEIASQEVADLLSTLVCGLLVTGLTVPLQAMRFAKQENITQPGEAPTYPRILSDAHKSPQGLPSLWKGANPRFLFVTISMGMLWKGSEWLTKEINGLENKFLMPEPKETMPSRCSP